MWNSQQNSDLIKEQRKDFVRVCVDDLTCDKILALLGSWPAEIIDITKGLSHLKSA